MFKRVLVLTFGLLVIIPGLQLSANLPANLVPANATIVGSVNVAGIINLPIFESFREELTILETTIGYRLAQLGTIPWFAIAKATKDPSVAAFTKAMPESVLANGNKSTYKGIAIYTLDGDERESAATKLDGWTVIGNLDGIKAVIDAKKSGKTLVSSGREDSFNKLSTMSRGLLSFSYAPRPNDIPKLKNDFGGYPELKDFLDEFTGANFGLDFASQNLIVKIGALSSAQKASNAANMLRILKMGTQQQVISMVNMMTAQQPNLSQSILQAWNSLTINSEGNALVLTIAIPGSLVESLAEQFDDIIDN